LGYIIVDNLFVDKKLRFIFWLLCIFFVFVGVWWVWENYSHEILSAQKMKGFIARWYLWKTGISAITSNFWHFMFGF
jgi:hypothetical protein